jgi:integrase
MSELSACELEDHAISLAHKGVGPRSINHGLDAVKKPYSFYCEKMKIQNKLKEVKHHKYKPKKRGILTQEELEKIVMSTGGITRRDELIVLLGAMCGLRKGEIIGLQYSDLDENAKLIHVQYNFVTKKEGIKSPKCGSFRDVPIPGYVKWFIDEVRAEKISDKFVIPNIGNPDKHCDSITIKRAFQRVLTSIGISNEERRSRRLVVHGLRHTFVSHLSAAGVSEIIIGTLSGHRDMDMVKRYSHTDGLINYDQIRDILAKFARVTLERGYIMPLK